MDIYLATDYQCLVGKNDKEKIGGTERAFLLIQQYLESKGHTVNPSVQCDRVYDIAIHSNIKNPYVAARKHVCRAGSFHTDALIENYDLIIAISKFFASYINKPNAVVIPVCYDSNLNQYKSNIYMKRRIITTANPNRHYNHMIEIVNLLKNWKVDFQWEICGGNKLYSEKYEDLFDFTNELRINYLGVLSYNKLLENLSTSHLMCYPNFSDNSETFCVSIVEASALGIPVVLPHREPFIEVLPDCPYFCKTVKDMALTVEWLLGCDREDLYVCDTSKYTEDVVLEKIHQSLLNLFEVDENIS